MSTAEIEAWNLGVALFQEHKPVCGLLSGPFDRLALVASTAALEARERLGHDAWAKWVRQGHDDARHQSRI